MTKKLTKAGDFTDMRMTRARRAKALENGIQLSILDGIESVFKKNKKRTPTEFKINTMQFDKVSKEYVSAARDYCTEIKLAHEKVGKIMDPYRSVQIYFDSIIDRLSGMVISNIVQPRTLRIPKYAGFRMGDIVNVGSGRIMGNVFELILSDSEALL